MASPKSRKPHSYVFLFVLGPQAKVGRKRVPDAFTAAPCYYYREDRGRLARKLHAIPEPDVSERDVEVTFAAIDAFVERCELKPELYADPEIEADEEHVEERGFCAGANFERAKEALASGGFRVCRVVDPLAIPPVVLTPEEAVEFAMEGLERHLDLTSLPLVLARIEQGADLPRHASQAESILTQMLGDENAAAFGEKVRTAAPGWHPELRDTLLLLLGRALVAGAEGAWHALFDGLPAAEGAEVRRRLGAWGLPPGGSARPLAQVAEARPVKVRESRRGRGADTIGARIASIEAAAAKAGVRLPPGASEAAIAATEATLGVTFPAEVRAFYLAHDGGPPDEAVCGNRVLLSLAGTIRQWRTYKAAFDQGALDDDGEPDEGVLPKWWVPAWIPVTYDLGGNHDVLDLSPAEGGRIGQIVAVWHDGPTRTVEGTSFLTWLEAQRWG